EPTRTSPVLTDPSLSLSRHIFTRVPADAVPPTLYVAELTTTGWSGFVTIGGGGVSDCWVMGSTSAASDSLFAASVAVTTKLLAADRVRGVTTRKCVSPPVSCSAPASVVSFASLNPLLLVSTQIR